MSSCRVARMMSGAGQAVHCGASTGLDVLRTGVTHGIFKAFVNILTFQGTVSGYGSSNTRGMIRIPTVTDWSRQ